MRTSLERRLAQLEQQLAAATGANHLTVTERCDRCGQLVVLGDSSICGKHAPVQPARATIEVMFVEPG